MAVHESRSERGRRQQESGTAMGGSRYPHQSVAQFHEPP